MLKNQEAFLYVLNERLWLTLSVMRGTSNYLRRGPGLTRQISRILPVAASPANLWNCWTACLMESGDRSDPDRSSSEDM